MIRTLPAVTAVALALSGLGAGPASAVAPAWRVLAATAPTNLPPATNEVQRVAVDASAGTFTLAFEGQSTGPLPYDAAPGTIKAALDALPGISAAGGGVAVAGGPGNPGAENSYLITFGGALGGRDLPSMTADGGNLQGGGATVTVTSAVEGKDSFEGGSLAVTVTNVGGAATAAVPSLALAVGPLPTGVESGSIAKEGWACPAGAERAVLNCTYSTAVPAGENTSTLKIPLTVDGQRAPSRSNLPVTVSGGGVAGVETADVPLVVSAAPARPGIAAFWAGAFDGDGEPEVRAGGHPDAASAAFWLDTILAPDGDIVPAGAIRTADVALPPGFVGDPLVTQKRCPQETPASGIGVESPLCKQATSRVGSLYVAKTSYEIAGFPIGWPVFNDMPAPGAAAEFTANIFNFAQVSLLGSVRSGEDFGVSVWSANLPTLEKVYGSLTTLEGLPASALGKALLRNPTDCSLQRDEAEAGRGPLAAIRMNSWANPDPAAVEDEAMAVQPAVVGCGALTEAWVGKGPEPEEERPTFSFQPSATKAAVGTAAVARLHVPQRGLTDPDRLGTSDLKKTTVVLPPGLTLNPSAADGLEACSEEQVGYKGSGFPMPTPIRFDEEPVDCPEASRLGTVSISTPLLEEELDGTVYLARQEENPFGSLIALYLVVESRRFGITLKLPGEVKPDPSTGQLTATFDDNPQLPFEDLTLDFRGGGPRSELATPDLCGAYRTAGALTPWSAESDSAEEAAQIDEGGFRITSAPDGGSCATSAGDLPFSPTFEAGTTSTAAGAYAPLVIKVGRRDGEQELTHLDFTLPAGVTARLAGVAYCSDAAIDAARGRTGKAELADPSCPAASRIGTVDTAAGVGSEPIHVGGMVYLAGPYGGAPLSSVVITPAVAGPFDLGDVVVRAPLFVDPETARITARSEEIPHILEGIPLKLRSVEIKVDRQEFSLNPTSCDPMVVGSTMSGLDGATASPSSRFQVGGCQALPFKPRLKLRVLGKTNRNAKPRLKAVLTARPGEAGIRRAQVNLPHSEFLEQNHIRTVCTRVRFAAGDGNGSACPEGSIYGRAKAWTPLLEHPLEGNVYLRSNGGERKLPDLVAALDGQIDIALWGKVDSGPNKGIRNTFEVVPDAPVSRFVLEMAGGRKGLLVNSEDLCSKRARRRAIVRLVGQNGKVRAFKPLVARRCRTATKAR
ncbi:MAG TPA: hypothetical protein VHB53_01525 [Solirubrobacterales bacterium]|nr:hypothetical protein [Solirubrobacterales bacterium]